MRYIFLFVGIWNTLGGINFLLLPERQALTYGMPLGNRWELHFIGFVALTFAAVYFSFFRKEPPREYLYLPFIFGSCKILLFFSGLYCYFYHGMPPVFMAIFSGGNLIMGSLFVFYVFMRLKKNSVSTTP